LVPLDVFSIMLMILETVAVILFIYYRIAKTRRFKSIAKLVGNAIILDSPMKIEIGRLKLLSISAGNRTRYKSLVSEGRTAITSSVNLEDLGEEGFYGLTPYGTFRDKNYFEAPGFKVLDGPFKNVMCLYIDPSKLPKKSVELNVVSEAGMAKGIVEIGEKGYTGKLIWSRFSQYSRGGSKIFGTRVRSVRLEICGKAPRDLENGEEEERCFKLVKAPKPNVEYRGSMEWPSERRIEFLYKDMRSLIWKIYKGKIMGYAEGKVKARLVMEISGGKKFVSEAEL